MAVVEGTSAKIQAAVGMSWIELQFLNKAVESLRRCRQVWGLPRRLLTPRAPPTIDFSMVAQVLMMTYVFAYYLCKTNESEMFESNQKDLENATEVLSGWQSFSLGCLSLCLLTH